MELATFLKLIDKILSSKGFFSTLVLLLVYGFFFTPHFKEIADFIGCNDFSLFKHRPVTTIILMIAFAFAYAYGFYQRYKAISLAATVKELETIIDRNRTSSNMNKDGSMPS